MWTHLFTDVSESDKLSLLLASKSLSKSDESKTQKAILDKTQPKSQPGLEADILWDKNHYRVGFVSALKTYGGHEIDHDIKLEAYDGKLNKDGKLCGTLDFGSAIFEPHDSSQVFYDMNKNVYVIGPNSSLSIRLNQHFLFCRGFAMLVENVDQSNTNWTLHGCYVKNGECYSIQQKYTKSGRTFFGVGTRKMLDKLVSIQIQNHSEKVMYARQFLVRLFFFIFVA